MNLRDVLDTVLLLYRGANVVRQLARDLGGVDTFHITVEALPFGDP